MPKKSTLILASGSKARKQLLEQLGLPFHVVVSNYPEDMNNSETPKKLAQDLALAKAKVVSLSHPNSIIIGADTFIVLNDEKIGKPKDIADAKRIIKSMSGKVLDIITGVAILKTAITGEITRQEVFYDMAQVKIKKMAPTEIDHLAHHPQALEMAGAFSIEGTGKEAVEWTKGEIDTVIGLPVKKVKAILNTYYMNS